MNAIYAVNTDRKMRAVWLICVMEQPVLVLNAGRTSLKASWFSDGAGTRLDIEAHLGSSEGLLRIGSEESSMALPDIEAATEAVLNAFEAQALNRQSLAVVGHRILFGADRFRQPVVLDESIERVLAQYAVMVPAQAAALVGIRAVRRRWPLLVQVAVFDTAFHSTLPTEAKVYALPRTMRESGLLQRFGAHGINHAYLAARATAWMGRAPRLITCHLGATASISAIQAGVCVDTSGGISGSEGLVMATRSGDIDPDVVLQLLRSGHSASEVSHLLEHESGLIGLTGSSDMRVVEARSRQGDSDCRLAIDLMARRIKKYIGAYVAVMGGVDALVFSGGIGERSALLRQQVVTNLECLGLQLDHATNARAFVTRAAPVVDVSASHSVSRILMIAADEALAIAHAVRRVFHQSSTVSVSDLIPVVVSARHVHLRQESIDTLFGRHYDLVKLHPVAQPGQFAARDTVTLVGPKGRIESVRVVGPARDQDQVEISKTDQLTLGLVAPIRDSGELAGSPGIRLEGPAGSVMLAQGVICSSRHIHMSPHDAAHYGVKHNDAVSVRIASTCRDVIYENVRVRVSPNYVLEMHIDTDEANAADVAVRSTGVLLQQSAPAS